LQIPFDDFNVLRILVRFEYMGIVLVPTAFLAFSISYTGLGKNLKRIHMVLFLIEPLLVIIFSWTNELHHLFWVEEGTFDFAGVILFTGKYGIVFWAHTIYSYVILISAAIILIAYSVKNFSLYKMQSTTLMVGLLIPVGGNFFSITGLLPLNGLDITPICFVTTCLLFAVSIFKFDLLKLTPVARVKILEAINEGVLVIDENNRITDINPAGMEMFEIPGEKIVGKLLNEILQIDSEVIGKLIYTDGGEVEVQKPRQGSMRYYRILFKKLDNVSRGYQGKVLIITDITIRKTTEIALKEARDNLELKVHERTRELQRLNLTLQEEVIKKIRAEEDLKKSKERYEDLFHNAPVGIYRSTPGGRLLDANPTLVKMLGYPSQEKLMKEDLENCRSMPDYPRRFFKNMIERRGEVAGLEIHWRRYDGRMIFVRENARAVRDMNGNTVFYEGTLEDITNTKKQAEMIRKRLEYEKIFSRVTSRFVSEPDLNKAVDSSIKDLGIFVGADRVALFLMSDDTDKIFLSNEWLRPGVEERIRKIDGIQSSLLKLWLKMVPDNIRRPAFPELEEENPDISLLRKSGLESMMVLPMTSGSNLVGFIGMERKGSPKDWNRDEINLMKVISEVISGSITRKQAETRVKEEWQRAEFYLDLINHDLGNINQGLLSRIQLFPYLLEDGDRTRENIDQLDNLIKRSVRLLRNVKIISDLNSLDLKIGPVDLEEIVDRTLKSIYNENDEDNIEIQVDMDKDHSHVMAGELLTEVLYNLLENSIKVQKVNEVWIGIKSRYLSQEDKVILSVSDKGPGICDENKPSVFDRKVCIGERMMTGLGLTVVRTLVEAYGGKIHIEDRIEGDHRKGTSFLIELSGWNESKYDKAGSIDAKNVSSAET
jgi:PAS domain S-box-containing protein